MEDFCFINIFLRYTIRVKVVKWSAFDGLFFCSLLLKGAKKRRLVRFWRIIFLSLLLKRTKKWGLVRFWWKFPYKFCLYP